MKKGWMVILAMLLFVSMTACNGESVSKEQYDALKTELEGLKETMAKITATAEPTPKATAAPKASITSSEADIEVSKAITNKAETGGKISGLVPTQQKFGIYDVSDGTMYGTYALEITNTTDSKILIEYCEIDFLDSDGKILGRADTYDVIPGILDVGEKAYVGEAVSIDSTTDPDAVKSLRVRIVAETTNKIIPIPEFSNINAYVNSWDEIQVNGEVKNTTGQDIDSLSIIVVLFGADDALIAAETAYTSDLKDGDIASFETSFWDDTLDLNDVERIEAYGYDYWLVY